MYSTVLKSYRSVRTESGSAGSERIGGDSSPIQIA